MEPAEIETETVPSILLPCTSCNRTFRPEALAKHSKVCEKILMKKRKQFDSSKQRLQGTEIESFVLQPVPKTSRKKEAQLNLSKSKWKEKVEQVRAIQTVKKATETPLSSQVVKPSDHEECPYCGRTFGPKAYERHTEFCKEQLHKLKVSNNSTSEARERLKVRTTYRGPLTNKVLNRDRYQPNRNRDPSPFGLSSSEIYDETPKSRGLSRNSSLRSSLRSKPETTPPPPLRRTMTQINPPSKGPRGSPKDMIETDLLQKTQTFNNKPRMISKEPIEKRMKPTNSKTIAPSSKTAGSHPKSPPKLNNIDVNTFKELNVISCFTSGSSKFDSNLKLLNNHYPSVVVQQTINSETQVNAVSKSENASSDLLKADDDHSSDVIQETINYETPLNAVPQNKIVTPDLPKEDNKSINGQPQSEIVTSDLLKSDNHFKSINDLSSGEVQETISKTQLNVVSKSHNDSLNNGNHFKPINYQHSDKIKPKTPQIEIENDGSDIPKADYRFKPINDNHPSAVLQETIKPETRLNVVPKSEIAELLSSKEGFNLVNCCPQQVNDKINPPPRDSNSFKEEISNQTDYTKSCNKNLAFTIEFEPDNRFLVYEHHKVGLKKSPVIFKKRISKSYESVKTISNNKSNLEDIEIQSNIISVSEEPSINKNCVVIDKIESSSPNVTQIREVKTTKTDDLATLSPSNEVSLSWRERVLEIMEVSDSPGNKNLNTLMNKNPNKIDLSSVSRSKSVGSQSEVEKKTNKPDSDDKCTDIDNSFLIDQELIGIFSPNQKTLENLTDVCLSNDDTIHVRNMIKTVQLDSEETKFIDGKNSQNVGSSDEIGTLQNNYLDVDLYFVEENNAEIGKVQNDDSLDVDVYFVEENNVADEILRQERSNMEEIVEDEQPAKESNKSNLFIDFDNKNVGNGMETNNLVDTTEVHLDIEVSNDNSPHLNDRYQSNGTLEEGNINRINVDNLDNTEMSLDISFVNEYDCNELVDLEDNVDNSRPEKVIEENDILKNVPNSASHITHRIENKVECQSLSDSELQKKQFKENEFSKIVKRDLDTTYENEEDALSLGKTESEDSPTSEKDKILRLAGQEFVLMANRNKGCDPFKGFQMKHDCNKDSEKKNMYSQMSPDNNVYVGSYKPNTYCFNTHSNSYKDSGEIYSDIFSHLKRSNKEGPKMTNWQTLPHGSDCYADRESVSEKDSLEIKFEEDSGDEFYIFQPCSAYDDRVPFETETFNYPFKGFSTEGARYRFSSSTSSYNSEEDQRSLNKNPNISQESLSVDSPLPFMPSPKAKSYNGFTSSRIPLLKSRRNGIYKSNTLPPLFPEPETAFVKCHKQKIKKKSDFSQYSNNFKNDYYTHFSNIKNSSEESDSDWDLSDYDTYEKKKTVFTRSSKTVYNKYYEQVEYSQEANEFQTIKTSLSNLPLPHADFFKEKEFKLPKIQSKHVPIDQRVHRKKIMDFEKLPLLRNFDDCKCSSRKEKETDEDVENRNHKFLNNSIDSAYSSLTRSSGAEGDTGKAEMSKFCHECGTKYPIAGAKFCCNCGMRRITL